MEWMWDVRERKPRKESKPFGLSNWENGIAIDGDGEGLKDRVWGRVLFGRINSDC